MKTALLSAALLSLAASACTASADDYLSGYIDFDYTHMRLISDSYGTRDLDQNQNEGTLTGTVQYRLNNCAAELQISGSGTHTTGANGNLPFEVDGNGYVVSADAGCKVQNLWIIGLGSLSSIHNVATTGFTSGQKMSTFGAGLHYSFNDHYALGFAAEKLSYTNIWANDSDKFSAMRYLAKSDYFFYDDLMLSTTLAFSRFDKYNLYSIFSRIEYKLKNRPISFYAGAGGSRLRVDDFHITQKSLTAIVGARFYFNDGSLKTIVDNSVPNFGN